MSLTLKYWGGRGLMEVPRQLLAIAGKFPPGDYTDYRATSETIPEGLEANLGRMPVATIGDQSIGQSAAINYYIAAENGLLGDSHFEAAQIISIYEHLKEMVTVYRTIVAWGAEPTEEALAKWFDSGATDFTGTADGANRSSRYLQWWVGRIEQTLGSNGFAVGSRLSLADVLLYNAFAEHLKPEESPDAPQWKREPFCSLSRTEATLASCPRIQASIQSVASNENLQRWLANRGPQGF